MICEEKTYETFHNFVDLTDDFNSFVRRHNIRDGVVNAFIRHTTAGLKIMESEILLLSDVQDFMDSLIPKHKTYRHDYINLRDVPADERINGHSHLKCLFLNNNEEIPVIDGKPMFGEWQRLFLIDMDPVRKRKVMFYYNELDKGSVGSKEITS